MSPSKCGLAEEPGSYMAWAESSCLDSLLNFCLLSLDSVTWEAESQMKTRTQCLHCLTSSELPIRFPKELELLKGLGPCSNHFKRCWLCKPKRKTAKILQLHMREREEMIWGSEHWDQNSKTEKSSCPEKKKTFRSAAGI